LIAERPEFAQVCGLNKNGFLEQLPAMTLGHPPFIEPDFDDYLNRLISPPGPGPVKKLSYRIPFRRYSLY
jgi:hypothetical protein